MALNVNQTMELTQAMQMLKFLEEERRKDKAAVTVLQEQVKSQAERLSQQADRIQELQVTLSSVQGVISQVTGFEQMVENYKNEIVYLIEQREEAWKKERAETARLHRIEMKGIVDQLGQLDKSIRVLPRYDEDLKARQTEEQRLHEAIQRLEVAISDLNRRFEAPQQAITYLEEQRRADNRRIAELEQDLPDLRRRIEAQGAKLPLLEEKIQKYKPRIDEAVSQIKEFEKPIEEMRVAEFRREQAVKKYLEQSEQVQQEIEEWRGQIQRAMELDQLVKRELAKFEPFRSRQEKRLNEMAEIQRLAEDRIKQQWEEWQIERDRELKKQQVIVDEQWREQKKVNRKLAQRLPPLESRIVIHQTQIETLFDLRRIDAHHALENVQDVVERVEQEFTTARTALRGE